MSLLGVTAWQRRGCSSRESAARSRGAAVPGALAGARELPAHMVGAAYHVYSCLIALDRGKNALCACSVLLPRESGACGCHGAFETINK